MIVARGVIGVANNARDEGGDGSGQADDGETDEGVDEGVFGFLDFAGVASGGDVSDCADNDEDDADYASDTEDPVDAVGEDLVWGDVWIGEGAVVAEKGDTDGV